jgi:CHRD domain-containing protein
MMERKKVITALAVVTLLAAASAARAQDTVKAKLIHGFFEVPAISSTGSGEFTGTLNADSIEYTLSYAGIPTAVTAAHIHVGQMDVSGGVSAFLCGGGGKPACPPSGSVTGTIVAADVIGPTGQGVGPGEFEELVTAMRAGVTYVNVHSSQFPAGEIRGQLRVACTDCSTRQ